MNDIHEPTQEVEIHIDDLDPAIAKIMPGKKHVVSFEISPGRMVSVPLTDEELYKLYDAINDRIIQIHLDYLAKLDT